MNNADFYVGLGPKAEWLGSIAWDGYPSDQYDNGVPHKLLKAKNEKKFRSRVQAFLEITSHATFPEQGWPWPWRNSKTTDFAYAWHVQRNQVLACCFGHGWFDPFDSEEEPTILIPESEVRFPEMSTDKVVLGGERSGLIVISS